MMGGPRNFLRDEVRKPKNTAATLSRLAKYFRPYTLVLLLVAALIIGATYTQVITPELTGQAIDCFVTPATTARIAAQNGGGGISAAIPGLSNLATQTNCTFNKLDPKTATENDYIKGLGQLVLLVIGLMIAGALANGILFYLMSWAGQHVLQSMRKQLFRHLHKLSMSFYVEQEAGSIMSRITNDIETINQAISFALVNVLSGILLIVWVAVKMLTLSWSYALVSMAVVPLMIVATFWISGQARKAFRRTRVEIGKVNANLEESIAGVRDVQAFNREEVNIEAFRESNASNRDANVKAVSFTAAMQPTLEGLGYVAIAIVTITGGYLLLNGQTLLGTSISLGLIIAFIGYVQRFNQPISQISVLWTNIQNAVAGAERIFELMDTVPGVQDIPGAQPLPEIKGEVAFDGVSAQYVPGDLVLKGVSFKAEPGQTIALVGQTGAGKTTIINLIPRFYDVVAGKITIDGFDVSQVTSESLRRQIGIVLQDTFIFNDTVMNNIRFGKPGATDDEVLAAARLSHADDFIQRLPEGYNAVLGEHGAGLSQGQRQLIAIARAALTDPRILILDEATSSVDTRTERLIQKALETLLKGRTSFVVAHRLSTIRNADQVLVIDGGEIVERGTHTSLLAQKGVYYTMYQRQFRKEEPETPGGNGKEKQFIPSTASAATGQ
jgi:ATP-binding cassette, subfamily B, multidrug efflux pump